MRNTTNMKSNDARSLPTRMTRVSILAIREYGSVSTRKLDFVPEEKCETGYTSMAGMSAIIAMIVG